METQTNGNGSTTAATEKEKSIVLDAAELSFKNRKTPAKDSEIKAAFSEYFKLDDQIAKLQAEVEQLMTKRTAATQAIVALRGRGRVTTKSRGPGQAVARGENAYFTFARATGEAELDV